MDDTWRIQRLEQQIQKLQSQLQQMVVSKSHQYPPGVRLAEVTLDPGSGATFGITFVDGEFTESSGAGLATYTDRQASQEYWCQNLAGDGAIPPEGTVIPVWANRDRWWTWFQPCPP